MDCTIRACGREDIETLTGIIRASFRDVAERFDLTPENCPRHPSNCTAEWVRGDMDRGVVYYIIGHGGDAMGCVALEQANGNECYLERLAVLPDRRRCGLGKALVKYVLGQAHRLEADRVGIGIIAEDMRLKEWYGTIGFVEGELKQFAHLPFRVTFMSYRIEGSSYDDSGHETAVLDRP